MLEEVYKWNRGEETEETAPQNVREGNCKDRSHQVALENPGEALDSELEYQSKISNSQPVEVLEGQNTMIEEWKLLKK